MTRHDLAPDLSEVMLAELHEHDDNGRGRRRPPATYLVAPCPKCGGPVAMPANIEASVSMKQVASGEGWESWKVTIMGRGSATHVHNE